MGFEMIGILIFAGLIEVSEWLRANAVLIFGFSTFLLLWLTGIITVVRRWSSE